jgi:hypothetical protein
MHHNFPIDSRGRFWQVVVMPFGFAHGYWPSPARTLYSWWRIGPIELRLYHGVPLNKTRS